MAGISGKALNFGKENKRRFAGNELRGSEFSDMSGLELYDFNARTYDPQIGRFVQIDPLSDEGDQERWNPYHYSYNNPATFSDPDGKIPPLVIPLIWVIKAAVAAYGAYVIQDAIVNAPKIEISLPARGGTATAEGRYVGSPLLMGTSPHGPGD